MNQSNIWILRKNISDAHEVGLRGGTTSIQTEHFHTRALERQNLACHFPHFVASFVTDVFEKLPVVQSRVIFLWCLQNGVSGIPEIWIGEEKGSGSVRPLGVLQRARGKEPGGKAEVVAGGVSDKRASDPVHRSGYRDPAFYELIFPRRTLFYKKRL